MEEAWVEEKEFFLRSPDEDGPKGLCTDVNSVESKFY
jgi:hypothetical protein